MEVKVYEKDYLPLGSRSKLLRYVIDENRCWNCVSHSDRGKGYKRVKRGDKVHLVHRYVYEQEFGRIEDKSLVMMHKCDNRACMNPEHLTLGTAKDNYDDAKNKGRNSKGEIHGMSKLTEEQVRLIRSSTKKGVDLAKELNVTPALISAVRNYKIWREVV